MKNYLYLFLLFTFVNLLNSCPTYPLPIKIDQNDPLLLKAYNDIDLYIQTKMKADGVKSFVATIVYMDEVVFSKAYGKFNYLDINSPNLTLDHNFRISSVTKVFTSLMMFKLRDQGIINSLDDDIRDYFPEFKIKSIFKKKEEKVITFRQLASHQSGLPRETPCHRNEFGTSNCTEKIILSKLSKQFLISKPTTLSHYSNLGFSLLGRVLGESLRMKRMKEQEPYEYWIENNIFKPLGMNNTTFNYDDIINNTAPGLVNNNNGKYTIPPMTKSGWNSPGGGIFSTARDMGKLLIHLLGMNNNLQDKTSPSYLKESTLNELFSPSNLLSDGSASYGMPFLHSYSTKNSLWILSKNGDLQGYASNIAFVKPYKLGLFFSSLTSVSSIDVYTNDVIDILIPVYKKLLEQAAINSVINSTTTSSNSTTTNSTMESVDHSKIPHSLLVGIYTNNYGNKFLILNQTTYGDYLNRLLVSYNGASLVLNTFELDNEYPYIKRISFYNESIPTCRTIASGSNDELIYFTFKDINGTIIDFKNNQNIDINNLFVYSVQIMGSLLFK
ncbi:hypothetical protein ACTFIZ_006360 [Dictyostelium cf. discoideum]